MLVNFIVSNFIAKIVSANFSGILILHEFNFFRYFNFRTTRFLAEEGFYEFHNWFDDRAWYPLGRIIGGTIYPGIFFNAFYTIS